MQGRPTFDSYIYDKNYFNLSILYSKKFNSKMILGAFIDTLLPPGPLPYPWPGRGPCPARTPTIPRTFSTISKALSKIIVFIQ